MSEYHCRTKTTLHIYNTYKLVNIIMYIVPLMMTGLQIGECAFQYSIIPLFRHFTDD